MNVACITTRNEAKSINALVCTLISQGIRVVVVDAGSTDATAKIARCAGAVVLEHDLPIGPALMVGWQKALDLGATRIVQLDAGDSHNPWAVWKLLENSADVVIGSRFVRGANYDGGSIMRRWGSQFAARMCNASRPCGPAIRDWTSGYRVFTARAAKHLLAQSYRAKMHGWQIEVLGHALVGGFSVAEVPITYTAGRSSFKLSTAVEAYCVWEWLVGLIPSEVDS